ncbi:MAG: hypothetical protein PQJ47_09870 [Sphaerochaetaceae bacterium]|nr:hypothetical protein [Sphaerochaetaceae bacterium]
MRETMQYFSHVQTIGLKERVLIIALLLILFSFLVIPIHQAAANRELERTASTLEKELRDQNEYTRILLSYITKQSLPEVVSIEAVDQGLSFEKLDFDDASYVSMEGGVQ